MHCTVDCKLIRQQCYEHEIMKLFGISVGFEKWEYGKVDQNIVLNTISTKSTTSR